VQAFNEMWEDARAVLAMVRACISSVDDRIFPWDAMNQYKS
jgi:hypothetical protein